MASRAASPSAACASTTPSRKRCSAWSAPAPIAAATAAARQAAERRDQVRERSGRDLEAARYAADRAFRQYDAADPANRLVAGELEARWNRALAHVAEVEAKIAAHDAARPAAAIDPATLGLLASNLKTVWSAPTTDARLKKRIVRTLIHEVVADIDDAAAEIVLVVHWIGGAAQRDPPAQAPARPTQQHIRRHHRRRAPAGADRQRRSDRRHPQPQWPQDRQRQPLDPRARHVAALAPPHPGVQARRGRDRALAQPRATRRSS